MATYVGYHPKFGTPARAISLQAVLACLLVRLGTFNQIIAYSIFVTVAFLAFTVLAVFVLRRKSGGRGALRIPGYPVTPICSLAVVAVLLSLIAARSPLQALLGTTVVLAGAPLYAYCLPKRADKPENKSVNI
jgi:APA family basic amino acid/polyamine antiporter